MRIITVIGTLIALSSCGRIADAQQTPPRDSWSGFVMRNGQIYSWDQGGGYSFGPQGAVMWDPSGGYAILPDGSAQWDGPAGIDVGPTGPSIEIPPMITGVEP